MRTWLKIAFLILASVFVGLRVFATVYYVSSTGSDGNNGTSINTPWQTVSHVNSIFSTLQPGDQVLFKRGETFYTSTGININKSGTLNNNIVIGAYGSGELPIIHSLITLTGWTSSTPSGVYESAAFSALAAGLQVVVVNGVIRRLGRYPNLSIPPYVGTYFFYESKVSNFDNSFNPPKYLGTGSITDNQLSATPDWDGAQIVFRTSRWTIDRALITSHSGTTINYDFYNSSAYEPPTGNGYFIQNHASTLDQFGEWYYNSSTDKIKLHFGGLTPSAQTVQAATATNLVNASGRSYITLDGIEFRGANGSTISATSATGWRIQNCIIRFNGINGILHSGTNPVFDNNQILYSYNDGIRLNGTTNAITTNNYIDWTYWAAGMGADGNDQGQGIRNDIASLVQYNTIKNSGFYGIFLGKSGSRVLNNFVDTCVFIKDDGGGIHGYVSHNKPATASDTRTGQKVNDNIVLNALGANSGTGGSSSYFNACGIYLDDNSNGYEMKRNFVANIAGFGIFAHNNFNGNISDNTVYNSGIQMLYHDDNLGAKMSGMVNTGNIFFSRLSTQIVAHYWSAGGTYDNLVQNMGSWSNNFYCRPTNENDIIQIQQPGYNNLINLAEWKALYGKDAGSLGTPATGTLSFVYNETKFPKTVSISGTFKNPKNVQFTGPSIVLQPYTGEVLIKTSSGGSNTPPTVSLTAPANGSSYTAPGTINLTATAADADGTISGVGFYNGSTLLATDNTSPYSYTWTSVPAGNYGLSARATDNGGAVTSSSSVSVTVTGAGNAPPVVSMTSPANNSSYTSPASIPLAATASDADGSITKVEFYYNGTTLINTELNAPYEVTWSNVPNGNYLITAKAYDNLGLTTTSSAIAVTVSNPGNISPTVSITSPATGTSYTANAAIPFVATASDADGTITKVEFYNGATLFHTEINPPYEFTWPNVPVGSYSITAKAYDNSGAITTSTAISLTVNNALPAVIITEPGDGNNFIAGTAINFDANATDANGTITKVEFFSNGILFQTEINPPYSFTRVFPDAGTYDIEAKATDNHGGETISGVITITVSTAGNISPTISITAPADNTIVANPADITLDATANDPDGSVASVSFYNGETLLNTDNTAPFTFAWNDVEEGTYLVTAKATDNLGAVTTSATVTIIVQNTLPEVSITLPVTQTSFGNPATVQLNATATDANGTVDSVSFYSNDSLLNTDLTAPYEFTWNNVDTGSYLLTAIAFDNDGGIDTSEVVEIIVANIPPTITIDTIVLSSVSPGEIQIDATAADENGTVIKVDFYADTLLLGTDLTAPYSFTWSNIPAGVHVLFVIATDNDNGTTSSQELPIEITPGTFRIRLYNIRLKVP